MASSRRASTGSALPLSDQPWYVKSLVYVGLPSLAAAYLLWFVVGQVTGKLDTLVATQQQHAADMSALVQHLQAETDQAWVQLSTLSRICLNTSKTDADRLSCVTVPRKP